MNSTLEAIQYAHGKLKIVDQLLLPHDMRYIDVLNTQDGWRAIHDMQVGLTCAQYLSVVKRAFFSPSQTFRQAFDLPTVLQCKII